MIIKSSDISVVVQGHVKGRPSDPYADRWTLQSLESVRRHLPDAQLILSTFQECDVHGLPYDTLVLSEDPGPLDLGPLNRMVTHTNRQIVSTSAGLAAAERPYALKMRYDLVLQGTEFLNYFGRFNERHPDWRIFRHRIISCTSISLDPRKVCKTPFAPSDWLHFGLIEDVSKLWNIALIPDLESVSGIGHPSHRYTAEQHIWVSFLRKYGPVHLAHANDCTEENITQSELTIVNNLVLLEPDQIPLVCLKYADPDHETYSKVYNYSHSQWLEMYQYHCLSTYNQDHPTEWTPLMASGFQASDQMNGYWTDLLSFICNEGNRIQLPWLQFRHSGTKDTWPGSDVRCLAALAKALEPKLVVEISQGDGASALALKAVCPSQAFIFTVRYQPTVRHREYCIAPEDMNDGRLVCISMDISLPGIRKELVVRMADADFIVCDIDDGRLLTALLNDLIQYRGDQKAQWFAIKQIRTWSVAQVWQQLRAPRLDLTSFSSYLGFGIARM